ncbi:alpha/beta fold hydrolase [Azospirillum picis]|uniref:Haloacetate dehalogenase n=1 Tax=Azospirillum picis TaxID=488438 RepID=A0ABU0MN18_9PROT|nr:alpha/beta hydrolase [Azospirillum picis]MBP2301177.1 haloacetate dehalogenase [Azospirillum picis]MDQ0534860.1 haloacetate dehalogenase [Azospirillum picis]
MDETSDAAVAADFYPGFRPIGMEAGGVRFAGVTGGAGPAVLLLHGYPQTHIAWRRIAPGLARDFTLVIPDLPGYGASRPAAMTPRWTKRRVGTALAALMDRMGHDRFAVVGHDRGARVGYRLALDQPDRVTAYASLAVIPTLDAMASVDHRYAAKAFHWFFLSQEADLPERLLAADPDAFIDAALARMAGGLESIEPDALDAYRTAFRDPAVRHAMCEDYRAALDDDLVQDREDAASGRRLQCPVHVLWPAKEWPVADAEPAGGTPVAIWSRWADRVSGASTSGGHLQPEDAPDEVIGSLKPFLCRKAAAWPG